MELLLATRSSTPANTFATTKSLILLKIIQAAVAEVDASLVKLFETMESVTATTSRELITLSTEKIVLSQLVLQTAVRTVTRSASREKCSVNVTLVMLDGIAISAAKGFIATPLISVQPFQFVLIKSSTLLLVMGNTPQNVPPKKFVRFRVECIRGARKTTPKTSHANVRMDST